MPHRLKILVAEDSNLDRFLFERAVERTGAAFNVRFVEDGQEAIDYLHGVDGFSDRMQYPVPALIITDLKMPRLNGFDVLKWVKSQPRYQTTPVVVLTSSDEQRDVDRAYTLGASAYLMKPGPHGDMPELVRALEAFWQRFARFAQT
jgi:CheY-like chemotaxis protein